MVKKISTQKTKLTEEEQFNMDELSDLSGEASVKRSKYTVPILKFNGNKGQFTLLTQQADGKLLPEEKGNEVSGVILKIRRVFTAFEKVPGDTISSYSNEHNSYKDEIVLFERRKSNPKSSMVWEGNAKMIREFLPSIRLKQYLYFLYNDEVVKLGVKGKSLASLFAYYKDFGPTEHLFQFVTNITCHQEESEGGLQYFVMDFKRGKESDLKIVSEKIREVAEALRLQDRSFQEYPKIEQELDRTKELEDEKIPVVDEEENFGKLPDRYESEEKLEDNPL